ncbi:putative calcium-binding protein C50C3.5 [Intoshia linei]|uniref:Putative calcium-binding protein C50C3.5 n=1 Tax=Intoshia linei TaxID=1819745 RepID=A0A177BBN4_9BILA|nr:putative calcium-binding protein C50C3.5 [Intoshia linei]
MDNGSDQSVEPDLYSNQFTDREIIGYFTSKYIISINLEFRQVFEYFDDDGSGSISCDELFKILKKLGIKRTKQEVDQMINEIDIDGNGEIDFNEFLAMLSKKDEEVEMTKRDIFDVIDNDKDSFIGQDDLLVYFKKIGIKNVTQREIIIFIRLADKDNDGKLNYDGMLLKVDIRVIEL